MFIEDSDYQTITDLQIKELFDLSALTDKRCFDYRMVTDDTGSTLFEDSRIYQDDTHTSLTPSIHFNTTSETPADSGEEIIEFYIEAKNMKPNAELMYQKVVIIKTIDCNRDDFELSVTYNDTSKEAKE